MLAEKQFIFSLRFSPKLQQNIYKVGQFAERNYHFLLGQRYFIVAIFLVQSLLTDEILPTGSHVKIETAVHTWGNGGGGGGGYNKHTWLVKKSAKSGSTPALQLGSGE